MSRAKGKCLGLVAVCITLSGRVHAQDSALPDLGELLDAGAQWIEENVPPEILDELTPPTPEEWEEFWSSVRQTLENGSVEQMAAMVPYAENGLAVLSSFPGTEGLADWLRQRLDYLQMATTAIDTYPGPEPTPQTVPVPPTTPSVPKPQGHEKTPRVKIVPPTTAYPPLSPNPWSGNEKL